MDKTPRPFAALLTIAFTLLLACAPISSKAQVGLNQTGPQQIAIAGLRSANHQGQFNAVRTDSAGNLYLLLDQKDGVRLLKTDPTATTVLAQALLGAAGDVGIAMALDSSGNVYVTGTATSGSLTATTGAAFPNPVDTTVNSFVARFDSSLNLSFVTFGGSGRTAASGIAATADAVFITGLVYGSGLPVTPSGIIQSPAPNSSQNGFVERFSSNGRTLVYATYLSGANGDTSPTVIAADASDNAYIAGFTTATGFPTIAALVPRTSGITSGFLTKLTPAGDGITLSTFLPGDGISSIAIDPSSNNLLLSGSISLGQFPVTSAPAAMVSTPYQVLLRMPLDGSAVLSSTVIAPGTQSTLTPGPNGTVWVDGTLSTPLLPIAPIASIGSGFAVRVSPSSSNDQTVIDQASRFGGVAPTNPTFASLPLHLNSLAVDSSGTATVVGGIAPTASSSLLATQTFDLPLTNAPTTALSSSVHDAVLPANSCTGSLCAGGAAYLARITPTAGPSLSLSVDTSPTLTLRNLGSAQATGLSFSATGFTLSTTCTTTIAAGDECVLLLTGSGPGTLTVSAGNATTQTATLPAIAQSANALVFSPKELDFGIQTASSPIITRILTVTNLGQQSQNFTSALNGRAGFTPYSFTEVASDCAVAGTITSKQLAPGATCHITLGFTAASDAANDGPAQAEWIVGTAATGNVLLTGFSQSASLSLSASTIDFGTQFQSGLTSARSLYLSNNSSAAIVHTNVALPANSPFTLTDRCPAQLLPHTVCQLLLGYQSTQPTSSDSTTLALDQGLSVLVTGQTIPQPGVNGSTANPSLVVSPSAINFPNAVVVTGISTSAQTVTIQNAGTSSFTLSLTLTGDFTDQTDCAGTLAAGASCSVVLTFAPSQPGARQGLLAVTAGSGTTPTYVTLSGTGTAILPANNGTFDFGDVPFGQPKVQWYKVTQPFTTLTAATLNPQFRVLLVEDIGYGYGQPPSSSFLSATTGSCRNCFLGVQFTPSSTGSQTATLTLASSTQGNPYNLNLTGNGISLSGLVLTPVSQDFGSISVQSTSAPSLFTLTNLSGSNVPITVNQPTLTGDFALSSAVTGGAACNGALAANASCFVQVFFAPSTTGQRTGSLTLTTSAGNVAASLTGFGAPDPGIAFNPSTLVFQNVPGPTATQQTITVSNTGSTPLQIGTPATATAAFSGTTNCATLAPGATCTLTVTYTPSAAVATDTLQLPVTASAGGNSTLTTYTVALSATYTAENAGLQILPATLNYGPSTVNALGGTRQFTINNLTAKSLTLAVALPRQFVLSGQPCAGLSPNASCTFSVNFLPVTNGDITGTLFAQATPTDGSSTLNGLGFVEGYGLGTNSLTVTGNISPGRIVNFGQVPSGQSVQQVLTLTNTSSAAVSTTDSTVTIHRITSQWPFLSTTTCGATLALNQSCTVTLSYTPLNQVTSGTASPGVTTDAGVLTIESDAVSGPDLIDLAGTASPATVSVPSNAPPLVSFTASQNSLTFSSTPIGFSSAPQYVPLANTGNTVLHVLNLVTSPDFSVTGACAVLVPGASCQLTISFTPQISTQPAGSRIGTVEITSDSTTSLEFLSLLGVASPSTLVFQPGALNFGSNLVGSTVKLPLQITNAGTTSATFASIATTGDYVVSGNCPSSGGTLAPNATCTLQVSFTPTASGIRTGTVSIASSVSASPLTAALTGFGAQSHLQISPTALAFGTIAVGQTASLSFTLANTGTASITAIKLAVSGDYAVTQPCSFTTLSAGASCSVTVAFTPAAAGARTGTLTITSSDPTSPNTIALSGTGSATTPPSSATFTLTVNGATTATQAVQQTRPAAYTLTLTPVAGFTGNVVLACNAVTAAPSADCSLQTSTIALNGSAQSAIVTINTLTSAGLTQHSPRFKQTALCILLPSAFLFWKLRSTLGRRPVTLCLAIIYAGMMVLLAGCGGSTQTNANLHFSPTGNYQYTVTASSTSGVSIAQTVTLNLTVQVN